MRVLWPVVCQGRLQVATKRSLVPLVGRVSSVKLESVPATITNMAFFDRLAENGIVRGSGYIERMCVGTHLADAEGRQVRQPRALPLTHARTYTHARTHPGWKKTLTM